MKSREFLKDTIRLYGSLLRKSGYYDRALPYIKKSLNGVPINYGEWKLHLSVLIRFDESIISPSVTALTNTGEPRFFQISLLSELQRTEASIRIFCEIKLQSHRLWLLKQQFIIIIVFWSSMFISWTQN